MSKDKLRRAGLKITLPRLKTLEILEQSVGIMHLSAEDIHGLLTEANNAVNFATVYRVLKQFEEVGLVKSMDFGQGHSVFELNREEHHDHMICQESGSVIEFDNEELELLQQQIADKYGYELVGHSLVLRVRPLASRLI